MRAFVLPRALAAAVLIASAPGAASALTCLNSKPCNGVCIPMRQACPARPVCLAGKPCGEVCIPRSDRCSPPGPPHSCLNSKPCGAACIAFGQNCHVAILRNDLATRWTG